MFPCLFVPIMLMSPGVGDNPSLEKEARHLCAMIAIPLKCRLMVRRFVRGKKDGDEKEWLLQPAHRPHSSER